VKRLIAFIVVLVASLGWLLGWSPYLRINEVAVTGIKSGSPLTKEFVVAQSGVTIGSALARVSEPAVRRSLTNIPRVDDVDVVRSWSGRVELKITERVPWAVAKTPSALYFVDENGIFFAKVGTPARAIPMVEMSRPDQQSIRDLIEVVRQLPPSLRDRIEGMSALSGDELIIRLLVGSDVVAVTWGSADETPLKIRVLMRLLAKTAASRWSSIDLSAPRAPTTRE
jgi:cell division protein FtsQ